jgi:hypothetical protein
MPPIDTVVTRSPKTTAPRITATTGETNAYDPARTGPRSLSNRMNTKVPTIDPPSTRNNHPAQAAIPQSPRNALEASASDASEMRTSANPPNSIVAPAISTVG